MTQRQHSRVDSGLPRLAPAQSLSLLERVAILVVIGVLIAADIANIIFNPEVDIRLLPPIDTLDVPEVDVSDLDSQAVVELMQEAGFL